MGLKDGGRAKDGDGSSGVSPEDVIVSQIVEFGEQGQGIVLGKDIFQLLRGAVEETIKAAKIFGGRRLGEERGHVERNAGGSLIGEQFLEIFCAERPHRDLHVWLPRL